MLKVTLNVLQELINDKKIKIGDAIIKETKIRLIEMMSELYPNHPEVISEINREFREQFNV